jgi:diguanylate cyclase (GGDEF)-like protein
LSGQPRSGSALVQERRAHAGPPEHDLDGLVRHVALADWLVLAVVLLHQLVAARGGLSLPITVAIGVFAALSALLRTPWLPLVEAGARLELETWAMAALISFVVWRTGGAESPLQSLYLLPIVLASLVLPAARLWLLLGAITVVYVAVAALGAGAPVASGAFAGRVLAAIGPLLIVAWLTSKLGTAVLAARRRAAALVEGDALTGLASRRVLVEAVKRELGDLARRNQPVAVLAIDLDGSRRLNELHGQDAGNAALQLVADALRRTLRETDLAARWGGDDFAVLLPGADAAAAQAVAQRIRHAVYATTLDTGARHVRCSVSIGVATAPRDGQDAATLLANAERRLERDRDLRRAPASGVSGASAAG